MAPRDERVVDKIFGGSLEDLPPLRQGKVISTYLNKLKKTDSSYVNLFYYFRRLVADSPSTFSRAFGTGSELSFPDFLIHLITFFYNLDLDPENISNGTDLDSDNCGANDND